MGINNNNDDVFIYIPSDENEIYKKIFPRFTFSDVKDENGNVIQEFIFSKPVEGYQKYCKCFPMWIGKNNSSY